MNSIFLLNIVIVLGLVASAIMAVVFEKKLPAILAFSMTSLFMAIEYIILNSLDLAVFEIVIGIIIIPLIFMFALRGHREGR